MEMKRRLTSLIGIPIRMSLEDGAVTHRGLESGLAAVHRPSQSGNVERQSELFVDVRNDWTTHLVATRVHQGDALRPS